MTFVSFDPLAAKNTHVNEAALSARKREISKILKFSTQAGTILSLS